MTLEVLGQDGLSYAPADERTLAGMRTALAGWNGPGDPHVLVDGRFVVREGHRTDVLAGRAVRRTPYRGR